MSKFNIEEKIEAIIRYQQGFEGVKTIAKSIGVDHTVLLNWIKQYEYHGESAFKKPYTSYTTEFKLDVLNYIKETGTSIRETAAIFNIATHSTIQNWLKSFESLGIDALKPTQKGRPSMKKETKKPKSVEESEALRAENERLRMENAYLKKLQGLNSRKGKITEENKAQIIYELRHEFKVIDLVKVAGIARSTYYYWVKQMDRPDKYKETKELIQGIFDEHQGRYGYRRITLELRNRGLKINHKTVRRLMNKMGLKCLVRMKKYQSYRGNIGKVAPNILERDFKASKPNEKLVTDVTEFHLHGEKLYLSPILDLYNGEIIAYNIEKRPVYRLVSEMLDKAFSRLNEGDTPILHSDQGWHYRMKHYQHALKEKGIIQSMSRKGNCLDNAVMENFFGLLKSELLYLKEFESMEHFKLELENYIYYYNHKRIKAKLKGMSPVQYRIHAQVAA
ncbi:MULTISPECIES: IS3 family transposase [Bacillaceae]|uniref:IS3 family transposase n=1 Tax=Bacillaceae TaxID=186817 RepID=UPI000BFBB426|nr:MULTISPECIES: IS3 family transposase [Bacillaceae]PGT76191.1 IS3 family transposase [Bacillus sp. AFS040349]UGB29385.1 IS3 family transposase [Metabacillus sp. B2-18]UGB29456.1 IS3 family transposase [Metabacillus sp. B2-18]UGB33453.1 IS3 family transposase [Metabacillus sp. B2-18]